MVMATGRARAMSGRDSKPAHLVHDASIGVMRRAAFVVALCLVAFVPRVVVGAALLSQGEPAFVLASDDGDAYDTAARWLAFGTPLELTDRLADKWDLGESSVVERWPRGYWLFLAAQYSVFGSAYASTIVLQALLGAAGALAAYLLARRVLPSEFAARAAALGAALSSTGVYLSAALYAEALYIPLLLIALALATPHSTIMALLAGVAFGLAELTRPLALPVFAVALIASRNWRLAVGFAVPLAIAHDPNVFTAGGREALLGHEAFAASALQRAATLLVTGGWALLGEPPLPPNAALRLGELLLAFVGALWLTRTRPSPALWLVLAAIAAIVVPPLVVGLPLVRYRAPADPLLILLICAAAHAAWTLRPWRVRSLRWSASPSQP
jgi:hypothetical protein